MSLIHQHNDAFLLHAGGATYVVQLVERQVAQAHWGAPLRSWNGSNSHRFVDRAFSPNPTPSAPDRSFSLDTLRQEYPGPQRTDFRSPAHQVRQGNGGTGLDLNYVSHTIIAGKPELAGLPSSRSVEKGDCETLELTLEDEPTGLQVVLSYTAFRDLPVVTRSVRFTNRGPSTLTLERALSLSLDLELPGYRWLQLSGGWGRERHVVERELTQGCLSIESRRGASSHHHNPFVALLGPGTTEDAGVAYGFNLVYSGNFLAQAEVDHYGVVRLQSGINPDQFSWLLEPGASFQTPEALLTWTDGGLGELSRINHRFLLQHICRGPWVRRERPVLINNWEATYFQFDEAKLKAIVDRSAPLGVELFVLDDGWFGHRDNDRSSLGDWVVDRRKLPGGLEAIADYTHRAGMKFGLWFEPEMVSVDSELYRAHPDWCLHLDGRSRSEGRSQLVLDLGRPDVRAYLVESLTAVLDLGLIDYVKWDMNRHQTEVGSALLSPQRQTEASHRYMLGLYEVLETITGRYPQILFESCSGGGGRFDPGMLAYMPQVWTSDNTDAVCRLDIQWGTSVAYPPVTMGSHVSAVPNHQVHRLTSLATRADVALGGAYGYELDPATFTTAEAAEVAATNTWYKEHRAVLQFGDFYRLKAPDGLSASWMTVSADQRRAVVFWYQVLAQPMAAQTVLRLKGLDPARNYRLGGGIVGTWGGDELMAVGLRLPDLKGDFQSLRISLTVTP